MSVGPASKVMPGISNVSVWPAGNPLVMLSVTVSPSFTTNCGPGRVAAAEPQAPVWNPQIGTLTEPTSVALPGSAHRSIATGAAEEAVEPAATRPVEIMTSTISALVSRGNRGFMAANLLIATVSFASLLT